MERKTIVGLICLVLVIGCAQTRPEALMSTAFDYQQHDAYRKAGTGTIRGQGFMRQQGGGTVTCAGSQVFAVPDTPFFREFVTLYRAGKAPKFDGQVDPSYRTILKQDQCDAQGNFTYTGMPGGRWLIFVNVVWTVRNERQGGTLMKSVQVAEGATVQALLTGEDFIAR